MPHPNIHPLDCRIFQLLKERCFITKAVLTDSGDVIQGIVFRTLLKKAPLEILGHVPPWLSLQEVVEISNGVCYVRGCHERISKNPVNRSTLLTAE